MKTEHKNELKLQLTLSVEETRLLWFLMTGEMPLGFHQEDEPEILDFRDEIEDTITKFWQKADYTLPEA